ncbi:phosphopantetheine-binding protein [Aphanothece hegewaldii CCALA 016]|uniref:Phosphopantetheine-binding protein n=1 Tax=Aphanothece hegewaldii CCALA 016 TaxID=2107694 RepID=A0A2T1LYZ1_9CHRO|nr:acyl carrier protein [Aphanothece hegewaldii]PSF37574.1 phosphopantetheine-binding protein [Aphanothece hegewaldii CCALA 016]
MSYSSLESTKSQKRPEASVIQDWLSSYLAQLLEIDLQEIEPQTSFERYGLDSSAMVVLSGDLQEWLGQKLDPTLLYDYPNIETLAQYLAQQS